MVSPPLRLRRALDVMLLASGVLNGRKRMGVVERLNWWHFRTRG
jgi:hypothetical protein